MNHQAAPESIADTDRPPAPDADVLEHADPAVAVHPDDRAPWLTPEGWRVATEIAKAVLP